MNSEELQTGIQALGQRLRELLAHYQEQQRVLQQLQKENEQLRQGVSKSDSSGNFSNSPESSSITRNEEQASALGSSIDGYIRDIDKCIAYLEQLQ